jgi:hypothetical protein
MIFASTPPHNTDPKPYHATLSDGTGMRTSFGNGAVVPMVYAPRTEFDQPRAHDANPILVELRRITQETGLLPHAAGLVFGNSIIHAHEPGFPEEMGWSVAHVEHARRVFTRLARWSA